MKSIKNIMLAGFVLLFLSCNTQESLDKYYVTHQEKQGFMTIDVPTSILEVEENALNETQMKAYESVSKLNFLGFKKSESDATTFTTEKKKLEQILSDPKYQELLTFSDDGKQGTVKYLGTPNAIDELILYGVEEAQGFAIVRVLGDDMNPQNIFKLLRSTKGNDFKTKELEKMMNFFKDSNAKN